MNARWLTLFSLALNLALAVVLANSWRRSAPIAVVHETAAENDGRRLAVVTPESTIVAVGEVVPIVESFEWREVADPDFKKYRDGLRALGCPERTVRLIIISEIREMFGARRRDGLALLQAQFWDLIGNGPDELEKRAREICRPLREAEEKLIDEVLGEAPVDPAEKLADEQRAAAAELVRYSWLPEEKRAGMAAIDKQWQEANSEMWRLARENKDRQPTEEAKTRLKELKDQLRQARQQLLTAEEFADYELRASGAANWAGNAAGFEPTEEEWRKVAKLQKERDDALTELNSQKPADAAARQQRDAEVQKLNLAMAEARREVLRPERSEELARAQDGTYRQVRRITQRYGLEDSVAQQVYELQRLAMQQADALRANKSVDATARSAALAAIQQETERTLQQTLGARAFSTYKNNDDGWFGRLGRH